MNSSRYYKSSNIGTERGYNSFWKRKDIIHTHFSRSYKPLSQFLEENDKKSNFIDFANVDLKKLSSENFNNFIENIITFRHKQVIGETEEEDKTITREALFNLMKHGLLYNKSCPIINLLISLKYSTESQRKRKEKEFDYDDYIIFYLKQMCKNFKKFDDFLDTMVLLSEYLSNNFLKNNSHESDTNKLLGKQKSEKNKNENEKEKVDEKENLSKMPYSEKDSSYECTPYSIIDSNQGLFDSLIKYIYCSSRYEIFTLYPVFSNILSILSKTNSYPASEILINLLLIYKIDISSSAINLYIDYLCRNSYLEQCHDILSILINYFPEHSIPTEIANYFKENYGKAHKKEKSHIIEKEKSSEKGEDDKDKIENPLYNYNLIFNCEKNSFSYGINIVSFGIYLKYLCKNDFLELALLIYDQLNKNNLLKDEIIYNLLIKGCCKKLDIKNLHRVYMDMIKQKIKPNLITYNTIIDAFIRINNTEKAFEIFVEMTNNNISPDNFTLITLSKGIYRPEHNKYLNQLSNIICNQNYPININFINNLLDVCIKLNDEKNLNKIFENIINKKYKNIKPNAITYNIYIKGSSKFKLYENVEKAFIHLINNSYENYIIPNDVTFNSLIDCYVNQNNMDKALETVNLMKKYKILPDNYTCTAILKGFYKNGFLTKNNNNDQHKNSNLLQNSDLFANIELVIAFEIFNRVKQISKPDTYLYNCIMNACLRFNEINKIFDIYREMLKNNINPTSATYGIMIKAYGMKGDIKSALEIYYKMKNENSEISDITYGFLINACITNNNLPKAFELYEDLKNESFEMSTILYTTLIKAYTKQKDLGKVIEIFNTMKKTTNSKPNKFTYNSIIDCCIKCNNFTLAYEYFNEMLFDINNTSENSKRPDLVTFKILIKGEIKNNCFGKARKLAQKLLGFNYIKLDCVLLNTLLDGCDKIGNYEEAMEIFSIFKSKKVICNMMTYSILMKICRELKDFENSCKLLKEMKENNIDINLITITCFIKTCCDTNHLVEGLTTFDSLPKFNIHPDSIAYSTIILGIIRNIGHCDYSDKLIKLVKKSIDDKDHLNKKIYIKCFFYLKSLNHESKADSLCEYLKEKIIINQNNNSNEENYEKKDS